MDLLFARSPARATPTNFITMKADNDEFQALLAQQKIQDALKPEGVRFTAEQGIELINAIAARSTRPAKRVRAKAPELAAAPNPQPEPPDWSVVVAAFDRTKERLGADWTPAKPLATRYAGGERSMDLYYAMKEFGESLPLE